MYSLNYKLVAESELLISPGSDNPNFVHSSEFITGSTIKGYFANNYILKNNIQSEKAHENEGFYELFLSGNINFLNAYKDTKQNKRCFPTPLSIQKEKNTNKIHDLFFIDNNFNTQTKPLGGFSNINIDDDKIFITSININKKISFHHARDKKTGTSKKGVIFNYESLSAGQEFTGSIIGDKKNLEKISTFLNNVEYLRLGRSTTSEYSKVKITLDFDIQPFETETEVETYIETEQTSMTFISPVIIYNNYGYSTTKITELENFLKDNLQEPDLKITNAFIKQSEIKSYSSVYHMPRPTEKAFKEGSCFIISGYSDSDKLIDLQKNGLGERKSEGYGRIVFGIQNNYDLIQNEDKKVQQNSNIPDFSNRLSQKIIKKVYIDEIYEKVCSDALKSGQEFRGSKVNSVIKRLENAVLSDTKILDEVNSIRNLKTKSRDRLTDIYNHNENLEEFIESKINKNNFEYYKKEINSLNTLDKYISFNDTEEKDINHKINFLYWTTLLKSIRKTNISQDN